jgi:hypothetical protein
MNFAFEPVEVGHRPWFLTSSFGSSGQKSVHAAVAGFGAIHSQFILCDETNETRFREQKIFSQYDGLIRKIPS